MRKLCEMNEVPLTKSLKHKLVKFSPQDFKKDIIILTVLKHRKEQETLNEKK